MVLACVKVDIQDKIVLMSVIMVDGVSIVHRYVSVAPMVTVIPSLVNVLVPRGILAGVVKLCVSRINTMDKTVPRNATVMEVTVTL